MLLGLALLPYFVFDITLFFYPKLLSQNFYTMHMFNSF